MAAIKIISTKNAPAVVGPYSQALEVNGFVFCSGQIGIDPKTGNLVDGIENQIKQILDNLKAVLATAGLDLNHVVKTTVFIKNMADYTIFNQIYGEYFKENKPARATVEVSRLPKDCLIEIDAIAVIKN
ncbi:reactive intermediate/imine deaminase [Candidatus Roizmanbacteria bacterium CG_4_10_14_0_2_um_filter_33_96]|uniref:Reactive intermediate/imine deaminase n=1 Tax=Candidatus Roizmanbacteria bacterium CG_4_10_14_0_2_um_filter_33_96 TaxID=1974821 RepID=A0A2M7U6X4_9BACT|nr:MAG: reactive intermediate/imine deaminase [Candidatus Roizmanbacteria bacterium CG_4_10_14_0_2_um_filter_33_96]